MVNSQNYRLLKILAYLNIVYGLYVIVVWFLLWIKLGKIASSYRSVSFFGLFHISASTFLPIDRINPIVGFFLGISLVVSGIGLLQKKSWASAICLHTAYVGLFAIFYNLIIDGINFIIDINTPKSVSPASGAFDINTFEELNNLTNFFRTPIKFILWSANVSINLLTIYILRKTRKN